MLNYFFDEIKKEEVNEENKSLIINNIKSIFDNNDIVFSKIDEISNYYTGDYIFDQDSIGNLCGKLRFGMNFFEQYDNFIMHKKNIDGIESIYGFITFSLKNIFFNNKSGNKFCNYKIEHRCVNEIYRGKNISQILYLYSLYSVIKNNVNILTVSSLNSSRNISDAKHIYGIGLVKTIDDITAGFSNNIICSLDIMIKKITMPEIEIVKYYEQKMFELIEKITSEANFVYNGDIYYSTVLSEIDYDMIKDIADKYTYFAMKQINFLIKNYITKKFVKERERESEVSTGGNLFYKRYKKYIYKIKKNKKN
jgi:hypothetical protein